MFEEWSGDGRAALVYDLNASDILGILQRFYSGRGDHGRVLTEILGYAYRLGAQTAIVEQRYIDADYRNEHSRFYSTTFRRYPSVAHRLHLFGHQIATTGLARPFVFRDRGYLGYTVLRPVPAAPVARTMLQAARDVRRAIVCLAEDRISLLGSDLKVVGIPFYAQDAQLSRCGQATMLATAYYHHLAYSRPRFLPGSIADAVASGAGELGRLVPSPGLNIGQIADAAAAIGLAPVVYPVRRLERAGYDIEATICRYLNSRLPVVVATNEHAFLLVGYERVTNADGGHDVRFLRQDDERGPYQWVDQWRLDESYGQWESLIVPLPPKVYLRGETAEAIGTLKIVEELRESSDPHDRALLERLVDPSRPLSWRSAVVPSNWFKRSVSHRGLPDPVAAKYQFAHLSRFVWIVELTDREARDNGQPCVLAEAVIDATDHEREPRPLAWRIPSGLGVQLPDSARTVFDERLASADRVLSVVDTFEPHECAWL